MTDTPNESQQPTESAPEKLPPARFKFYLSNKDNEVQAHTIDAVETVCTSVFPDIAAFDVVISGEDANLPENFTVMVTPSLVRLSPVPERRYFGDFNDPERLHVLLSEDRPGTHGNLRTIE